MAKQLSPALTVPAPLCLVVTFRAQAAAAHQQQLLDALSQQAAAAGRQERQLAVQRRQLAAEIAGLEQQQRPELEAKQAAAVEAEEFEAAAAIDEQLQVRSCRLAIDCVCVHGFRVQFVCVWQLVAEIAALEQQQRPEVEAKKHCRALFLCLCLQSPAV
jgi:hypothetical protein